MKEYEPELGQLCFGQPWKQYEASNLVIAALDLINRELCRIQWNIHQKEYDSPFHNTGNSFRCDSFEVMAYDWGDDEQPYNFKWKDVEISWYKYHGRGETVNQDIVPDRINEMLDDCMVALKRYENEFDPDPER
jgi:hypothetical protein